MRIPKNAYPLWKFCFVALSILRPLCASLKVEGVEHLPKQGGVVLACNHPGGLDSFVLGLCSPRQVFYMAKRELFNIHPFLTYLLHRIGAFPINRGARDAGAIEHSVKLLKQGRVLGMFPEGTRNRGKPLRKGKTGAVRIAMDAGVPVIPVAILGVPHLHRYLLNPFQRTELSVQFGQPMRLPPGTMEDVQENTTAVMLEIARMLPPDLHGHYAEALTSSQDPNPPDSGLPESVDKMANNIPTG